MVESIPTSADLDAVFHALGDPTRREILRRVTGEPRTVSQLAEPFPMSLAAISKHLQVLERAQLVDLERRGSFRMVRLRPHNLQAAKDWLSFYETFWSKRLDALQTALETQPGQAANPAQREDHHG